MIVINAIYEGEFKKPERVLTSEELEATNGYPVYSDIERYVYFESDQESTDFMAALPVDLYIYKQNRINQVDEKTRQIIACGFPFDGKTFSLSINAQISWTQLLTAVSAGIVIEDDFPFCISDIEDRMYSLEWAEKELFFKQPAIVITTAKISGSMLKQQIVDAQSKEEIDLIIDNR